MDTDYGRIAKVFQNKKVEEMEKEKKKYSVEELLQFAYKHNQIPEILFAKYTECRYVYTSELESLIIWCKQWDKHAMQLHFMWLQRT